MKDSSGFGCDATAMTLVTPDLSIVVPTFNEAENVAPLIARLEDALAGHAWEAIFVDDNSPDATAQIVGGLAGSKPYIRCIRRIGRRGLSSAVIEGVLNSTAPYVAVMDADLQHDERILPTMLRTLTGGTADLAIGSRYASGGGVAGWSRLRHAMSRFATYLSRLVVNRSLQDPMSGFFMVRRASFLAAVSALSGTGYKILLDLLASTPHPLRFIEIPYEFRPRIHGESKLNARVIADYAVMLVQKRAGAMMRPR
jgi:dolichol-phosphate mannosyltransferase